jgi:hypothetical protein
MKFSDLGPKLEAKRDEIETAKKRAARKAKREAAKAKKASSRPIKKKPPEVRTHPEWIGDPLDDPLPF